MSLNCGNPKIQLFKMAMRYIIMVMCFAFFINTAFRSNIFVDADNFEWYKAPNPHDIPNVEAFFMFNAPKMQPFPNTKSCFVGTTYYRWKNFTVADEEGKNPALSGCTACICDQAARDPRCVFRPRWHCQWLKGLPVPDELPEVPSKLLSLRMRRFWKRTEENDDFETLVCSPGISKFDDCTAENSCSGCRKCECLSTGEWKCEMVFNCSGNKEPSKIGPQGPEPSSTVRLPNFTPNRTSNADFKSQLNDIKKEVTRLADGALQTQMLKEALENTNGTNINVTNMLLEVINMTGTEDTAAVNNNLTKINTEKFEEFEAILGNITLIERSKNASTKGKILSLKWIDDPNNTNAKFIEAKIHGNGTTVSGENLSDKENQLAAMIIENMQSGSNHTGNKDSPIVTNITYSPTSGEKTYTVLFAADLLKKLWELDSTDLLKESNRLNIPSNNTSSTDTKTRRILESDTYSESLDDLPMSSLAKAMRKFLKDTNFKANVNRNYRRSFDNIYERNPNDFVNRRMGSSVFEEPSSSENVRNRKTATYPHSELQRLLSTRAHVLQSHDKDRQFAISQDDNISEYYQNLLKKFWETFNFNKGSENIDENGDQNIASLLNKNQKTPSSDNAKKALNGIKDFRKNIPSYVTKGSINTPSGNKHVSEKDKILLNFLVKEIQNGPHAIGDPNIKPTFSVTDHRPLTRNTDSNLRISGNVLSKLESLLDDSKTDTLIFKEQAIHPFDYATRKSEHIDDLYMKPESQTRKPNLKSYLMKKELLNSVNKLFGRETENDEYVSKVKNPPETSEINTKNIVDIVRRIVEERFNQKNLKVSKNNDNIQIKKPKLKLPISANKHKENYRKQKTQDVANETHMQDRNVNIATSNRRHVNEENKVLGSVMEDLYNNYIKEDSLDRRVKQVVRRMLDDISDNDSQAVSGKETLTYKLENLESSSDYPDSLTQQSLVDIQRIEVDEYYQMLQDLRNLFEKDVIFNDADVSKLSEMLKEKENKIALINDKLRQQSENGEPENNSDFHSTLAEVITKGFDKDVDKSTLIPNDFVRRDENIVTLVEALLEAKFRHSDNKEDLSNLSERISKLFAAKRNASTGDLNHDIFY